jgi:predicted negative regulator of RcsB-dependent stress response
MARQTDRKAARITRKSLKEDPFRDTMFWLVDWVYQRRVWFISGGTIVVVVLAGGFGYYYYHRAQLRAQSEQFYQAERIQADPTLDTAQRRARARQHYESFVASHPSSRLAPVAWMHIAALAWSQNDAATARKAYQAVLAHSESTTEQRDLAHMGLATLDESKGDFAAAAAQYKAVSDGPYEELKSLSLGRVASAEHQDQQARQFYEKAARVAPGSPLGQWARENLDYHP